MSESLRTIVEIGFDVLYLIVVWTMVYLMSKRLPEVSAENYPLANRFRWAFFLLALGDTGHVGFRTVAYLLGGLEANPLLVGLGALAIFGELDVLQVPHQIAVFFLEAVEHRGCNAFQSFPQFPGLLDHFVETLQTMDQDFNK